MRRLADHPQIPRENAGTTRTMLPCGQLPTDCVCLLSQLTASEMLFQATRQKANPNFVMVKYVHDKDEEGRVYKEFTAYQVSEQCVKMVDGNTLRCDPGDPFRLYSAKKVKCVNPDTRNFEFTNKVRLQFAAPPIAVVHAVAWRLSDARVRCMGHGVLQFDTEWMTALVGIQQERAELHAYFRPPNRVNKDGLPLSPLSVADLGAMFRQVSMWSGAVGCTWVY